MPQTRRGSDPAFLPRNPDCHSAGTNNKLIVLRMILHRLAFGGRVLVDMRSLYVFGKRHVPFYNRYSALPPPPFSLN